MPIPVVEFQYEGELVYSPFTGNPADPADGDPDDSVLFVYYGNVPIYAAFSERALRLAHAAGIEDPESLPPEELLARLDVRGALAFRVDAGWNGINHYAFAPMQD